MLTKHLLSSIVWAVDKTSTKDQQNKESRNTSGKLMGLHTSDMVVMLTDVSDRVCEEVCNPVKQLKKAGTTGQESKVYSTI